MSHISTIGAREAKNRFGEVLDAAREAPVHITKNGRPAAVILSASDYELFEEMEDAIWAERVRRVVKNPKFLSVEETKAFMNRILKKDAGN